MVHFTPHKNSVHVTPPPPATYIGPYVTLCDLCSWCRTNGPPFTRSRPRSLCTLQRIRSTSRGPRRGTLIRVNIRGAFQYQKISLPKMSFGLVQSGWGESECFNKNLAPGSSEVFKDIFRAYRNAPQGHVYVSSYSYYRYTALETSLPKSSAATVCSLGLIRAGLRTCGARSTNNSGALFSGIGLS